MNEEKIIDTILWIIIGGTVLSFLIWLVYIHVYLNIKETKEKASQALKDVKAKYPWATRFPGVKDEDIIESKPIIIREDEEKPREEKKWPINLDLKLKPFKKGKRLSDIPNAIIITSQKYGEHKVNMLKVAIYSFNDQCFYSDGEKYPQENIDVVAYGTYDFNKVQEI